MISHDSHISGFLRKKISKHRHWIEILIFKSINQKCKLNVESKASSKAPSSRATHSLLPKQIPL